MPGLPEESPDVLKLLIFNYIFPAAAAAETCPRPEHIVGPSHIKQTECPSLPSPSSKSSA